MSEFKQIFFARSLSLLKVFSLSAVGLKVLLAQGFSRGLSLVRSLLKFLESMRTGLEFLQVYCIFVLRILDPVPDRIRPLLRHTRRCNDC